MKTRNPFDAALITLCIITFIGACIAYPSLPGVIPIQWDIQGKVSNYSPKIIIFVLALIPIFIYFIMSTHAHTSNLLKNLDSHKRSYRIITYAATILLNALVWLTITVSYNSSIDSVLIIKILVGIIFIITGNYLPTTKQTHTIGVRNKWTYNNLIVWRKSNKLCGYLFVFTGILFLLTIIFPNKILYYFIILEFLLLYVVLNIYSYYIYKKLSKN